MLQFFRREAAWLLGGAMAAFLLASLALSDRAGIRPDLTVPYAYSGDASFYLWLVQRLIEGQLLDNPRSGYPFGSSLHDFPIADIGNFTVLKLLSLASAHAEAVFNLFVLFSFPAGTLAAYIALRRFGLWRSLALTGGLAFAFLPFHFLRLTHLLYLWYFVAPLFFLVAYRCYRNAAPVRLDLSAWLLATLVLCASFGAYYALFGSILIGTACIAAALRDRDWRPIRRLALAALVIAGTVAANVAPSLLHGLSHGTNQEAVIRASGEAEIYGLKLAQMLLPVPGHRSPALAAITEQYEQRRPLVNENRSASLGLLGALGFLLLGGALLLRLLGRSLDQRLEFLGLMLYTAFLFGTVGGLGAIFSEFVSPLIRGWNRISVFIGFGAIAGALILLQKLLDRHLPLNSRRLLLAPLALGLTALALWDQTPRCPPCGMGREEFPLNRDFVRQIEQAMPPGAAIYQLPYMPFPEGAPLETLNSYDLALGFVHSRTLRWSFGGMKGREGSRFFQILAQQPIERQIAIIRDIGFTGLYLDRRAYRDRGAAMINSLAAQLGAPPLQRADGNVVFFRLPDRPQHQSDDDSLARARHWADIIIGQNAAKAGSDMDFSSPTLPAFVRSIGGFSAQESWGRWTDADLARCATIQFTTTLPQNFVLALTIQSFATNSKKLEIWIGSMRLVTDAPVQLAELRLPIALGQQQADTIRFCPHAPVSPQQLSLGSDRRRLGIGLSSLRIE